MLQPIILSKSASLTLEDAEDLSQVLGLRLLKRCKTSEETNEIRFKAYCDAAAGNIVNDHFRKKKLPIDPWESEKVEEVIEEKDEPVDLEFVKQAMTRLKPAEAKFLMEEVEALDDKKVTRRPRRTNAENQRLFRIRDKARKALLRQPGYHIWARFRTKEVSK